MRSLELFVGAGGLALGLHGAGIRPMRVIERDPYCCDTIRQNQFLNNPTVRGWHVLRCDVRSLSFSEFEGGVDLISGGPPCQPFSIGGKHRAYDDTRDMFPQAIRAVAQVKPKAFIFENVRGLTRVAFRNYFEYIKLRMEHPLIDRKPAEEWIEHLARLQRHHTSGKRNDLHYRVVTQVLNAADFGVPQKRERVFFVGFRDDLGTEWSFPKLTHSQDALLWDQMMTSIYWETHNVPRAERQISDQMRQRIRTMRCKPASAPWRTVRDALVGLPDPELKPRLAAEYWNHQFQAGARSYTGHTGSPLDEPSKALKAGVHGVPGGENMLVRPDGSVRYFSVREAARLQTFPDEYVFHGSWSETMRQLGNAVPVELAACVGRTVVEQLQTTS